MQAQSCVGAPLTPLETEIEMRSMSILLVAIAVIGFGATTTATAGSPDGVTGELAGRYFGTPPNTPGALLPDPCPGLAIVKKLYLRRLEAHRRRMR